MSPMVKSGMWSSPWHDTDRTPESLRDAALKELERGEPGPTCRELAVKATGHLVAQGWLKRESRDPHGGFRDQRPPDTLLDLMHRDPQGVQLLAEALVAGRRSSEARAVRADGSVIERAAGDAVTVTNQWIRQTFSDAPEVEPTTGIVQPATGASTPRERVATHVRTLEVLAGDIERTLVEATKVQDDDHAPFLQSRGWAPGEVEPLAARLRTIADQLGRFGIIADLNPARPTVGQLDLTATAEDTL